MMSTSAAGSSVVLEPTFADGQAATEIPPDKEAQLLQLVSEMKDAGHIPKKADERHIMMKLHLEMVKEQQAMQRFQAAFPKGLPPALRASQAGQGMPPPGASPHVAVPIEHDHSFLGDEENKSLENLLIAVTDMLRQNPKAINDQDGDGDTLLHRVCAAGQEKLVHLLLINGANVNSRNNLSQTPFHIAAKNGEIMIMQLLSENGADVQAADTNGWTALHHAASSSAHLSPQSLQYLSECCHLSLSTLTNDGQSLLHIVASIKKDNNRFMLPLLLSSTDLDADWVDKTGSNAMHYAAKHVQLHMCYKLACKRGAKLLLVTNAAGKTPMDIAKDLPYFEGYALAEQMMRWARRGAYYKPNDSRPYLYFLWMTAPALFMLAAIFLSNFVLSYQGFIYLAAGGACMLIVSRKLVRIDQITRLPDPSRLGAFVTAYVCVISINLGEYATNKLPESGRALLLSCLYACMVAGIILYYILLTRDPGFTHESKRKETGEFYTMRDLVVLKKTSVWCPICQLIPTKPSKHCKLCERCVYRMDHHCLYTMRCIGNANHYTFVWFNICLVCIQLITLSLLPSYTSYISNAGAELNAFLQIFMYDGFLFVVLLGTAIYLVLTVPLLVSVLNNVGNGYTYYFSPHRNNKRHVSGLTFAQRISNIIGFLRTGRMKYTDPNYQC
ncbi:uncharacterized protein [Watersipora subatra]|uniref:uncharacterized protein n=1 Tax=Watersipora subatra TaxID=2589382 RepID=UPI00355BCA20